jgi:hypothetical protein
MIDRHGCFRQTGLYKTDLVDDEFPPGAFSQGCQIVDRALDEPRGPAPQVLCLPRHHVLDERIEAPCPFDGLLRLTADFIKVGDAIAGAPRLSIYSAKNGP